MTMTDIDAAYAKAIAEADATYEAAIKARGYYLDAEIVKAAAYRAAFRVRFAAMVAMAPKCVTTSNTKEAL